jgi:hypothetical protein
MKLASKFTLTLVLGIVLVHAGSAIVRAHREEALFHQDITRDSKVLGRALGHAVKREWQTRGERAALDLIDDATDWESGNRIRWVWKLTLPLSGRSNTLLMTVTRGMPPELPFPRTRTPWL